MEINVGDIITWKAVNGPIQGQVTKKLEGDLYLAQTATGSVVVNERSIIKVASR